MNFSIRSHNRLPYSKPINKNDDDFKMMKKNDNEMNTMNNEVKLRTLLCHAYCETTEGFQMHCDVIIMVQLT